MTRTFFTTMAVGLALACPVAAVAKGDDHDHRPKTEQTQSHQSDAHGHTQNNDKKTQAKQTQNKHSSSGAQNPQLAKGDKMGSNHARISQPERYGLSRNGVYMRTDSYVYRIDPDTREVLTLIGAVIDVLN